MIVRPLATLAFAAFAVSATASAQSGDPKVDRVCKVLTELAEKAKVEKPDPDTMQMWVVFGLANEFGDDMEFLGSFVSKSDEATTAACPEARQTVIDFAKKDSLAAVIR